MKWMQYPAFKPQEGKLILIYFSNHMNPSVGFYTRIRPFWWDLKKPRFRDENYYLLNDKYITHWAYITSP